MKAHISTNRKHWIKHIAMKFRGCQKRTKCAILRSFSAKIAQIKVTIAQFSQVLVAHPHFGHFLRSWGISLLITIFSGLFHEINCIYYFFISLFVFLPLFYLLLSIFEAQPWRTQGETNLWTSKLIYLKQKFGNLTVFLKWKSSC